MSALDMFCSALGAFMFLAILFFGFVPNLGPKDVTELNKKIEQLNKDVQKTQTERDAAQSALAKQLEQGQTDIAIVIDASGSMDKTLNGLKNEIGTFAAVLGKLTTQSRIAIIAYRDECMGAEAFVELPLTPVNPEGIERIKAFSNGLVASGGTCNVTYDEAVYQGMLKATQLEWSAPIEHQYIYVIGDNPAHPPEIGLSQTLARTWGDAGRRLSTLAISDPQGSPANHQTTRDFYKSLAENGHGAALLEGESFALSILKAMAI